MELVEKIAEAVLYEGYLLYPYRRSTLKNQQRWTFGCVYPHSYSEANRDDPWTMQTQCLVVGDDDTTIEVTLRFLQVADREVCRGEAGSLLPVEALRVGEQVYRPWEEAIERTVPILDSLGESALRLGDLVGQDREFAISIQAGSENEPLIDTDHTPAGALIRTWRSLEGTVEVTAERLESALALPRSYRITVRIANTTPWTAPDRDEESRLRQSVLRQTLVSTHTILQVREGEFVSLLEPPPAYQGAAEQCRNVGVWPVLVGEEGERHTVLSSPIILYDYPRIAPESPGDLFDATEIDELLRLSIMTLTDDEKLEMRESDPKGREILERTESLTPDQLMQLHAAVRGLQTRHTGGQP